MRVFWKINQHHTLDSFDNASKLPEDQVQIYTWRDATLRELTELIQQVVPEAAEENVTLDFCAIYLSLKAGKANVSVNISCTDQNSHDLLDEFQIRKATMITKHY